MMQNSTSRNLIVALSVTLCLSVSQFASAQRGGGRFFGGTVSRVRLASIEQVQNELKFSDELKTAATEISTKLREDSRALRDNGGDRAARREQTIKLNAEASEKLVAKLDDAQKKRLTEIYIQLNGASAIMDKEVSAALKLTEEQQEKLSEANNQNREARTAAFQNFRDLSADERTETAAKLRKESNERVLAVLNDNQRGQFGEMKGKEFEIDRSLLRRGRGGRRGGN